MHARTRVQVLLHINTCLLSRTHARTHAQVLPSGVDGLVGMIRNWTFTAFFCMSELWGDVCLGLLFWGLANDITSLEDAGDHSLCVHVWCVCV